MKVLRFLKTGAIFVSLTAPLPVADETTLSPPGRGIWPLRGRRLQTSPHKLVTEIGRYSKKTDAFFSELDYDAFLRNPFVTATVLQISVFREKHLSVADVQ